MKALAIFLIFTCGTLAVPMKKQQRQVCDDTSENRFLPSKKYIYKYVGTSTTGIEGITDEKAEIKIMAFAHVTTVSSCVFHLKVDGVSLYERSKTDSAFKLSRGNEEFVRHLEENSLTFRSVNGRIDHIKTSRDEPVYVTNIKRGILSALQLEFKEDGESIVNERDISGDCRTRYLRMIKGEKEDIYKVKNLPECTKRSKVDTLMHPVFYSASTNKRTLLDSTSSCHYKVVSKEIVSVECKETHLLRPFSYQSAGAMTTVKQRMELIRNIPYYGFGDNPEEGSSQKSDLRFDFTQEKPKKSFLEDISSIEKILWDLVKKGPSNVMAPMLYTKLVFEVRRWNLQGIEKIWRKFYICSKSDPCSNQEEQKYSQLIVEALSQCGTEACVEFIVQEIRRSLESADGINSDIKQLLTGLAMVRNPTEDILDTVWTLLKDKKNLLPENTITILGSMIRTHCEVYPTNCLMDTSNSEIPKAAAISRFLIDQLYDNNVELCKATQVTADSVIYALRAIGNARYMATSPHNLVLCALESNYKNISAIALHVLRDIKLDYRARKDLKLIYIDYNRDPELRMMAYLAWMKTPTKEDIKAVLKTLQGEKSTQVGSLVWSHLTSMNTSVEPTSGKSIGIMIEEVLKETQKTPRYFNTTSKSVVWQKSTFNEKHNVGMSASSHVIYHPESLLPRHMHLNMTVDVLGGAFPVFETNSRMEGLERIWERLFGPAGHFPDKHIKRLVKVKEPSNRITKRSTGDQNDLKNFHERVNMARPTPSGLFSIKLFGNELALFTMKDIEWLEHEVPLLDWLKALKDLKDGVDKTFTKHLVFLQDSVYIPTSIGLPLALSLNGTAVGGIHVTAKGDLLSLFWGPANIKFDGSIKPSAVVSLSGMMSVNAFHSKIGIQLNSTILSSMNISANVIYKEGENLQFHYNIFEKPQEILNISTVLLKQVNEAKTPVRGIKQRKTASLCTSSMFDTTKYVGLDLCSKISVPVSWDKKHSPFLPLAGPTSYSMNFYRSDPKLTTYKLEVNVSKVSEFSKKTCLELSTPKSSHKRNLLMNLTTVRHKQRGQYHLNISIGNHYQNWTTLNYMQEKTSNTFELNFTSSNVTHMTSMYHMTKVHNRLDRILTNTSLLRGPIGQPVTVLFLNATLNNSVQSVGRMLFSLTHRPLNFAWQVKTVHNFSELSTNISCIMRCGKRQSSLLNHKMVVNITHIKTSEGGTTERGLRFDMHINDTRRMSMFGSKKIVKTNDYKFSTYFTNCTFYNRTTLTPYTSSINFTVVENLVKKWNEMTLNVTYKNNSITLETLMKNSTRRKSMCLRGTYLNGTSWSKTKFVSCLAYLNGTESKNLILNLTSLGTTHKLNTTWLAQRTSGMFVNYNCGDKSLANLTVSYRKQRSSKFLDLKSSIGDWKLDLQHSYQDISQRSDRVRRILITHKATNRTEPFIYNKFNLTFLNSLKNMLLRVMLSTRTKEAYTQINQGSEHWHAKFVNKTVSWKAELVNETKFLKFSSLFDYQVLGRPSHKQINSRNKIKHSIFWNRVNNFLNASLDLLPNTTLGVKFSGTFIKGINVTTKLISNQKESLQWRAFISKKQLISNLTLWNRTIMAETSTCVRSRSLFLNISTWNHVTRNVFNGSISWYLNATTKKTYLNITLGDTPLYFTAFSLNDSHLEVSFVRSNRSELYKEISLVLRRGGKLYTEFNVTSLKKLWKELNLKTFDIPRKLVNITVNFTSRGANIKKTGYHLKMLMANIKRELIVWKYTRKNLLENLSNLTKRILEVASHSLPDITSDYSVYVKDNRFDIIKFWKNLTTVILNIPRREIQSKDIAKELIQSLKDVSSSFNKARVIGNLSKVFGNIALNVPPFGKVYLRTLTDSMVFYFKNLTNDILYYLKKASKDIGASGIHSRTIDKHVKERIPKVKEKLMYVLYESEMVMTEIVEILRTLREDVGFFCEHLVKETYFEYKRKDVYKTIKELTSPTSLAGGILHPSWLHLSEILKVSTFNATIHTVHQYLVKGTTIEKVLPFLSQPDRITEVFHKTVYDESLEKVLNRSFVKTFEMFNFTLRLPSWHLNKTHDKLVYIRNFIALILNDTDNVMNGNSNKKLIEILNVYIKQTRKITEKTWNMTMRIVEGIVNVSVPTHKKWESTKVWQLYWDTSETMPWARPLIRMWNRTMFSLMKLTPEKQLKYWTPRFLSFTLNKAVDFTKYVNECLTDEQTQTPRINVAYFDIILKVSTIHKMESRPNITKYFLKVSRQYQRFTDIIFNSIKKPKKFLDVASKTTMTWKKHLLSGTSKVFDVAERVVDCSLVNDTINNATIQYIKYNPMMELEKWVRNRILESMFNEYDIPFFSTWKTMTELYQMETQELMVFLTPKNQTGLIINQRQYITFDKRSFQLPEFQKPGCTFLIARDFLDGHFTVLAKQNSFLIITPEAKMEIYKDGRIKANFLNSQKVMNDLPLQFGDLYAIRDGSFIRVVNEERGFEFELELKHFNFGVYISGFYHNRTLGLLGTNTGEVYDDWRSPVGKNETEVERFVNSWLLESGPECTVRRPAQRQQRQRKKSSQCEQLLKSKDSPFKKCFNIIDPKAFFEACIKDVTRFEFSEPQLKSHCSSSAAYVRACAKSNVMISVPSDCNDCNRETRYMESTQDVDIVVISSEGMNMKFVAGHLKQLIERLSKGLEKNDFKPRFGLVGFNGNPIAHWKGHSHTLNSKLFGCKKEFVQAIDTLDFAPRELNTNISDGYMGLYHATKYPFRPGAKIIFLLLTDSIRVPDGHLTSEIVIEAMKNISAKLIVIGDYHFKDKMYGGNTEDLRYYKKGYKYFKAVAHKNIEKLPEDDDYVKVALKTKGTVFMVKKLEKKSSRKYLSEMVEDAVLNYSKGKKCLQCRCVPDMVGKAKELCKITSNIWCVLN